MIELQKNSGAFGSRSHVSVARQALAMQLQLLILAKNAREELLVPTGGERLAQALEISSALARIVE